MYTRAICKYIYCVMLCGRLNNQHIISITKTNVTKRQALQRHLEGKDRTERVESYGRYIKKHKRINSKQICFSAPL
jgi:hypothetical protein